VESVVLSSGGGPRFKSSATLARDLQAEFPEAAGFSSANLWRMKAFYEDTAPTKNSHRWCEK